MGETRTSEPGFLSTGTGSLEVGNVWESPSFPGFLSAPFWVSPSLAGGEPEDSWESRCCLVLPEGRLSRSQSTALGGGSPSSPLSVPFPTPPSGLRAASLGRGFQTLSRPSTVTLPAPPTCPGGPCTSRPSHLLQPLLCSSGGPALTTFACVWKRCPNCPKMPQRSIFHSRLAWRRAHFLFVSSTMAF